MFHKESDITPKPKPEEDKPTESYIAKPRKEESNIQDDKLKNIEIKLIEQLANGEISNKVYNDAISRLQNINKKTNYDNPIYG